MKPINKSTQKILDSLFQDMKPGTSKKLDNEPGTYMSLSIERLTEDRFSIAHYYEQNGDLVPDPDMELWRGPDGCLYTVALQQNTGFYTRAIEFGSDGKPSGIRPKAQRDLNEFANMWVKNIKAQQGL